MGTWNLGSVATECQTIISDIPSSLSGAPIERMADRTVGYMENYTGQTIGSVGIATKYQAALLNLTIAELASVMQSVGADASQVSIGEFSISKGQGSNLQTISENFRKLGMQQLSVLGRKISVSKAFG